MQDKRLHIISFDNPFPPNYGGVIDVFYKIRALHHSGCKIYLHCFVLGEPHLSAELKSITEEVHFYKKVRNPLSLFSKIPFAVKTRFDPKMIANISRVSAPVLFEGLQTTMLLHHFDFTGRKKYLRLHNLESDFFSGTAKSETNWIMKALYATEALKYKAYQNGMNAFDKVFSLSVYEHEHVEKSAANSEYVPVFHGNSSVKDLSEFGQYCFYHGDLRLADNKRAVSFLIEIFSAQPSLELVIASDNGKDFVRDLTVNSANITFVELTSTEHLNELLAAAHVNVMLSFQRSGTKLKLVNALFNSRFCLINKNMVDDKRVLELCELAVSKQEFVAKIKSLNAKPYKEKARRDGILNDVLNDRKNAEKLIAAIY